MQYGEDLPSYNMGNAKKEDDDDQNEIQLHRIKPQEHFLEAQVQEGDTLQAIALRFYCPIPITPYSVLTEMIPTNLTEPLLSTSSQTPSTSQELTHNSYNDPGNSKTEPKTDWAIDCNEIVLNSTLAPAVIPYTETEPVDHASEDTQLLPNKEKISVEAVVVKQLTSHGADFGLKWFHLLCFVLVLGVAAPLIYVIFFLETHDIEHPDLPPLHTT
ncbi:LysM and putative peptidoglycan-binding domain-containing protein 3 [Operophtera brumata]|uniref:LysM and putative peptidoglycan-binding domain-containing protein 3 n=1 Tax=Operophtera brumata TaxID=104452 RepID=A0A0L7KZJ8_OPEBR|nr:LysM and putative peptidoglycan-binding domain-containing protein 3 [Operophtera brumata]